MRVVERNQISLPQEVPPAKFVAGVLPPGGSSLAIKYHQQTEDYWCWAACAQMVFTQPHHTPREQCSIVSDALERNCCPSPNTPAECDIGKWPDEVYPPLGLRTKTHYRPLEEDELRTELKARRPVLACYHWTGSGRTHVALIVGEDNNGDFMVYDPHEQYGAGTRAYSQIRNAYGYGEWIRSFVLE